MLKKSFVSFMAVLFLSLSFHSLASAASVPFHVSARSAVLMDDASGRVLYEKNDHQQRRIASITKIMTAIVAIESGKMDERVTISKKAAHTEGSSLYLKPGDNVSLKDLVYGLMLRSGNDAAVAIAQFVGGSQEGFTQLMNEKAALIGMDDTWFANPHGLDDHRKMYSSAYDMALLMKYAMKNETFRKIVGTKVYHTEDPDGTGVLVWRNKNRLLTRYPYTTGGKTGYTTIAKRTLVSTAEKDGMGLIAVTLNDRNDWKDHVSMFHWGFRHYEPVTVVDKGKISGIDNSFYKGKVFVKKPVVYPLADKEKDKVTTSVNLYKPWKKGKAPSPVGHLFVWLNDEVVAERPLYYKPTKSTSLWLDFENVLVESVRGVAHD